MTLSERMSAARSRQAPQPAGTAGTPGTGPIAGGAPAAPAARSNEEKFIAVTEAEIYGTDGKVLYRSPFLTLNKEHIIWIRPDEQA